MRLIEPAAEYCRQIREYKDAFLECGDSMDGTSDLRPFRDSRVSDPSTALYT